MWFVCIRRNPANRERRVAQLTSHFDWIRAQHDTGRIVASGPTTDRVHGIYILNANSLEEARATVETDPGVAAGDCTYELFAWDVRQLFGLGEFHPA